MPTKPKLINNRVGHAGGGLARIMERTGVLRGCLFFALFFHSVHSFATVIPAGQIVPLEWNPSPDTNVVGYNIYHGGASGDYTNMLNVGDVTNASVSGLVAGVTYYFAATAYDSLGQESVYSKEISYSVPALPTVQVRGAPAGQFILSVSGLTGHTYNILVTEDFSVWRVIGTVTLGTDGSSDFTDPNAANFPQRFYRTQETP